MVQVFTIVVNSQLPEFGEDLLQNSSEVLFPEMAATGLLGMVFHLYVTVTYKFEALAIFLFVWHFLVTRASWRICPSHSWQDLDQGRYNTIN